MTLSDLPADDGTLYLILLDGAEFGVGTADEIRALVADRIIPDTITLSEAR